ncbi:IS66 family insertion sequence element accessory protein TnpB [uncultured Bacteroides sp.]|uniref:IS66 family insertion sequence element accessory protein TnpB n=2 Tax=Bacteroides TaxID=816 RepID=UPI00262020D3|nr:IS66 family insertion sequence element accessory protein TnpB [uncultured Bacteroides sp.]
MFCLSDSDRFFLYPYPTDMRKSFYSLSGIVTEKMGKDVQEGDAFIFINKSLTNMKILHAEYGGLVIYNMRLESGTFRLSDIDCEDSSASLSINWSELTLIVHGISPSEAKSYTVKQKRSEHGNAYVPWDDEADRLLCRMYDEGKSISLLSDIFERTKDAIRSRLKKLGKIK